MRLSFNGIEFSTSSRLMAGSCAIDIIQLVFYLGPKHFQSPKKFYSIAHDSAFIA